MKKALLEESPGLESVKEEPEEDWEEGESETETEDAPSRSKSPLPRRRDLAPVADRNLPRDLLRVGRHQRPQGRLGGGQGPSRLVAGGTARVRRPLTPLGWPLNSGRRRKRKTKGRSTGLARKEEERRGATKKVRLKHVGTTGFVLSGGRA